MMISEFWNNMEKLQSHIKHFLFFFFLGSIYNKKNNKYLRFFFDFVIFNLRQAQAKGPEKSGDCILTFHLDYNKKPIRQESKYAKSEI